MPSKDAPNILEKVMASPPDDLQFAAQGWRRGRVNLGGLMTEFRVLARAVTSKPNPDVRKFLIIGRARSGTTLLTRSLDCHPDVMCDGEVLNTVVASPIHFLENLAKKSGRPAYGAKLLSYQMIRIQKLADPIGFLEKLQARGFGLIHLQRETFEQTLSLQVASMSGRYHSAVERKDKASAALNPEQFVSRVKWNMDLLEYENFCLKDVPHLKIDYGRDLLEPGVLQGTLNRAFEWIGVSPVEVAPPTRKMLSRNPRDTIENFDEVVTAMNRAGIGHLVPEAYR